MKTKLLVLMLVAAGAALPADSALALRARKYLVDLIRLQSVNPPGNETRVARYLKAVADAEGIPAELLGDKPSRLNFVARLKGTGEARPLLLIAHSDVVPADPSQWTVPAFDGLIREGYIYGRGTQDTKGLLAAELALMVELKRRNAPLKRDVILLSESDEEAGSTGIQWLIANAWEKIDAEFALNEAGSILKTASGERVFQIQTSEKIPTRLVLTGKGSAGHGSLPRPDNPVVHLARAVTRLADAEQPVALNTTTRTYLKKLATLADYQWLGPLVERLDDSAQAPTAAAEIRAREPNLDAMLHTTVSPTMLQAGMKINIIPNSAEAQVDVRRLPTETREEVFERFRRIIADDSVEIRQEKGQQMPATEPSSMTTELYLAMQAVFEKAAPGALIVPLMQRGATDGSFLRAKGMAVYGVPVFAGTQQEQRAHGNDERLALSELASGTELLLRIVERVALKP